MSIRTVFRNHGKHIHIVKETVGALNVETGIRPTSYQYKRVLALVGSKNFGFDLHIKLDETLIILTETADLVIIGETAHKTVLKGNLDSAFVYHIDKVVGDELRSIMAGVPPESEYSTFFSY